MEVNTLKQSLKKLIGYSIEVYSKDGKNVEGYLLDVKDDYLTVKSKKNQVLHFNVGLVQGISRVTKEFERTLLKNEGNRENSLQELLSHHALQWVTVKCHNEITFTGVLTETADDHIILIIKDKQLFIPISQILEFSAGFVENNDNAESNNEEEQQTETENNQSNQEKENNNSSTGSSDQSKKEKIEKFMQLIGTEYSLLL